MLAAVEAVGREFMARLSRLPLVPDWLPAPGNRRFYRAIRTLDAIVSEIVRRRRQDDRATVDLLSMLLHAHDVDGSRMDDRQIRAGAAAGARDDRPAFPAHPPARPARGARPGHHPTAAAGNAHGDLGEGGAGRVCAAGKRLLSHSNRMLRASG